MDKFCGDDCKRCRFYDPKIGWEIEVDPGDGTLVWRPFSWLFGKAEFCPACGRGLTVAPEGEPVVEEMIPASLAKAALGYCMSSAADCRYGCRWKPSECVEKRLAWAKRCLAQAGGEKGDEHDPATGA